MKTKYIDLIEQTYEFPQEEFKLEKENQNLYFHGVNLMGLVEQYGTPLKFTYLPKISENIQRAQGWFNEAISKIGYPGKYMYSYCTKSSHFRHVLEEVLKNEVHIETSSAFDLDIVENLKRRGKISDETYILCNGFKRDQYISNIARLINSGHKRCVPIIDNFEELNLLCEEVEGSFEVGIRIASEEEPKFEFYTSRLGIGYKDILPFYETQIAQRSKVRLKMLHFFINTGIKDTAYYWNELQKSIRAFVRLKKICPSLDSLNIGGGFPVKNSLAFEYDYQYLIEEIVHQIFITCRDAGVAPPNIFTEFGSFTVGESEGVLYKILYQKKQNDREKWNMINSSFITTLPDSWAINKRFIMLAINRWQDEYERVFLGGLTCDSDDYYNSEQDINAIFLPKYHTEKPLYIGFFNTGAYQDSIGGYGGLQHCLIPAPKKVIIRKTADGEMETSLFAPQQTSRQLLKILDYE